MPVDSRNMPTTAVTVIPTQNHVSGRIRLPFMEHDNNNHNDRETDHRDGQEIEETHVIPTRVYSYTMRRFRPEQLTHLRPGRSNTVF